MIPAKPHPTSDDAWRDELRDAIDDVDDLLAAVDLTRADVALTDNRQFPLRVPRAFVARMRRGDANDPLLRQVIPLADEDIARPGFGVDPLGEADAIAARGVLQKYSGRVLLIATGACAVNCRYCFRRHFPYADHRQDSSYPGLDSVAADPTIREVILSGGDPLVLTDAHLERLVRRIASIPHVVRLRLHTRVPIVLPSRLTQRLNDILTSTRLQSVMVVHANHPNEIDEPLRDRFLEIPTMPVLNQAVLLRGVNDDAATLAELSEALMAARILPYYLHLPDRVAGTAHFDVSAERAIELHQTLAATLPGYLVPRLVKETPGASGKEAVAL